ncbi:MAG: tetratricopeptide repeat protein [Acidobacteriota bacterium]|nr:tetratricopeptide repeat protein [Acidobacteriota bacterium]
MPVRASSRLLIVFALALVAGRARGAESAPWAAARAEDFTLAGHLGERELSDLASSLEEFRAVFRQILPKEYFAAGQPTVVVVFASDGEYEPFKPLNGDQPDQLVAGFFKPGQDINYITLAWRGSRAETTPVLFHEYVHALVRNRYGRAPLWLDEGLAEYYSAYALASGGRQVRYGETILRRAQYLRGRPLLPLSTLLTADRYSPLYSDHSERGVFYAQSWALVHYLLSDRTGARERQLATYLQLVGSGADVSDAIRRSFQISPSELERRLAEYVREGAYTGRVEALNEAPAPAPVQTRAMSDAQTQARLGDLLLRTDRPEQAETYLARALAADQNIAAAHVSLGLLRMRQNRAQEAIDELKRATELEPQNYLAHYYYAGVLDAEGSEDEFTVAGYAARSSLIRAELKRAVELAPDFPDAQGLLVLTDIERNPNLDEATKILERLTALAPDRREIKLLRARLALRREEFDAARAGLKEIAADPFADPLLRAEARRVLDTVPRLESMAAGRKIANGGESVKVGSEVVTQPCDMPEPGPQWKPARFAGEQACGRLLKIDCAGDAINLVVRAGERTLSLHAAAIGAVKFITYTGGVGGSIECGERAAPELVLVTYKPTKSAGADKQAGDGELKAVEFVPEGWSRTSQ